MNAPSQFTTVNFERPALRTSALLRRPELLIFLALLLVINSPLIFAHGCQSLMFQADAVRNGQWWRLFTHPFVHVTWYHLLLDGTAFLTLYSSLLDASILRRLTYVCAAAVGSLLLSWAAAPSVATNGLCGLSGIAHGLMAVSALEMVAGNPAGSADRRVGSISFILVISKSAFEALTGRMFFAFLDFGLLGDPVAVSHAGGIIGSLLAMLLLGFWHHKKRTYLNR
jgi:rhomboid family GlyGly-CTERM serine protease